MSNILFPEIVLRSFFPFHRFTDSTIREVPPYPRFICNENHIDPEIDKAIPELDGSRSDTSMVGRVSISTGNFTSLAEYTFDNI